MENRGLIRENSISAPAAMITFVLAELLGVSDGHLAELLIAGGVWGLMKTGKFIGMAIIMGSGAGDDYESRAY